MIGFFAGKKNRVFFVEVIDSDTGAQVFSEGSLDGSDKLRSTEVSRLESEVPVSGFSLRIHYSTRGSEILGGWLGMARTVFVCVVLAISVLLLSNDSERLVLNPLDQMVRKIDRISKNPLEAAELEGREQQEEARLLEKDPRAWAEAREAASYEPAVLEKIVIKIGMLLAIGFGEAGSEIIAKNMAENSGAVNPMIEGKKMAGIFGFCDIRAFEEATEALKTDIMPFVNCVAGIVHSIVNLHQGAANKNIGEAFLLVWKLPETAKALSEDDSEGDFDPMDTIDTAQTKVLADLSVISFVKVIAAVAKSSELAAFCGREAVMKRMGGGRVVMGFGLHIGWAIEGAIGSKFKIDASYLSPNVNMAARLEAATRQFGVKMLVSGALVKFVSPKVREVMRHIDTVTVKGSVVPVGRRE